MKLGAEPKKVAILGALLVVAGILYWVNSRPEIPPEARQPARAAAPVAAMGTPAGVGSSTGGSGRSAGAEARSLAERPEAPRAVGGTRGRSLQEFKPSLRARANEKRPDPMTIDPTLRLDLLARLQTVRLQGGNRNLFQFGAPPLPKTLEPKIIPNVKAVATREPAPEAPAPPAEAVKPPPPAIPLKYYGYALPVRQGVRRAFFLDGEDIIVAGEGELIKKRYKVVRIGISNAVVEDTEWNNQQTLRIVAPENEGG